MRRIPATIVTGFLGAGKTSLVRHLMATASGHRLAIIVNEFGELGIDREVLLGCGAAACSDDDIVELANGCLCCTVADAFLPTLSRLIDRAEPPGHIVIETSGLALPKPLVQAFAWPEIRTRTTVDGVIAVIDAAAVASGRFADDPEAVARQRAADPAVDHDNPLEEVFTDQLACADLVILNKTDLLDPEQLIGLRHQLGSRLRPGVKLVASEQGRVAPGRGSRDAARRDRQAGARPNRDRGGTNRRLDGVGRLNAPARHRTRNDRRRLGCGRSRAESGRHRRAGKRGYRDRIARRGAGAPPRR